MRTGCLYGMYYIPEVSKGVRMSLEDAIENARKAFFDKHGYPALKCEYNVLDHAGDLEISGIECYASEKGILKHHFVLYPIRDPIF